MLESIRDADTRSSSRYHAASVARNDCHIKCLSQTEDLIHASRAGRHLGGAFQAEQESRLADEIAAFNTVGAKEEELLELLHKQRQCGREGTSRETAAAELHESEIQIATATNTALLLQHAESKATAMVNISVSGTSPPTLHADKLFRSRIHRSVTSSSPTAEKCLYRA